MAPLSMGAIVAHQNGTYAHTQQHSQTQDSQLPSRFMPKGGFFGAVGSAGAGAGDEMGVFSGILNESSGADELLMKNVKHVGVGNTGSGGGAGGGGGDMITTVDFLGVGGTGVVAGQEEMEFEGLLGSWGSQREWRV